MSALHTGSVQDAGHKWYPDLDYIRDHAGNGKIMLAPPELQGQELKEVGHE